MNWKLVLLLTLLGATGSIALSWLGLPLLVDPGAAPGPLWLIQVGTALQSIVMVALAACVGAWLAPRVGLAAPALGAALARQGAWSALRPQCVPAFAGGVAGAALIVAFHALAPAEAAALHGETPLPLAARMLYGGVTEEILVRWGLMSLFAWIFWRLLQRGAGRLGASAAWAAICLSAFAFGLAHLPAAIAVMGELSAYFVFYVTAGNAMFGVLAGYLFWRYGLESAIMAHVLAHALAFVVRG